MKICYLLILVIMLSGCATILDGLDVLGDKMGVNDSEYYCEDVTDTFLDYINRRCVIKRKPYVK